MNLVKKRYRELMKIHGKKYDKRVLEILSKEFKMSVLDIDLILSV